MENNKMTDRELLELAAKAIGITLKPMEVENVEFMGDYRFIGLMTDPSQWERGWFDPLTDDGDALRLAVKLGMNIDVGVNPVGFTATAVIADYNSVFVDEYHEENAMKATRRAIVRAAAEIGKSMA